MFDVGCIGARAAVVRAGSGHEAGLLQVEDMHLALFDHVVPAVQREISRLHAPPHHGVVHEALELQHHGALFGAPQRLGRGLHGQHGFAAEFQPALQVEGLGRHFAVERLHRAAVAVSAHDDAPHLQAEHREFDGGGRAVVAVRAVVGRHEGAHVAHQEEFTRPRAGEQVRHQARIGAADEQRGGPLALRHQVLEALAVARERIVVEAPQALQQLVGHGERTLLHERRVGAFQVHALQRGFSGEHLQVLPQRIHPGLLAQRERDGLAHLAVAALAARVARHHFHHVQAEAAVHQARQHADFAGAEHLARELGRAIALRQPAQVAAFRARGAVGPLPCGTREGLAAIVSAAQLQQLGLGAFAQALHVHAWRHGIQDVPQMHALAIAVAGSVRLVVAAAGLLRRIGHGKRLLQQRLDGLRRGFGGGAVVGGGIARHEQAGALGRLAQQLGAGALAQRVGIGRIIGAVQRDAVHRSDGARDGRCGRAGTVPEKVRIEAGGGVYGSIRGDTCTGAAAAGGGGRVLAGAGHGVLRCEHR